MEVSDEAEDDGADEEEGTGDGDIVDENLTLGTTRPTRIQGAESACCGTAVEIRIAHRHFSLLGSPEGAPLGRNVISARSLRIFI